MGEKFPKVPGQNQVTARDIAIDVNAQSGAKADSEKTNPSVLDAILKPASIQDYTHLAKNANEYLIVNSELNTYVRNSRSGISGISKGHILFGIQEEQTTVDVYQTTISESYTSNNIIDVFSGTGSVIVVQSGAWEDQLDDEDSWLNKYIEVLDGDDAGSIYKIVSYNSSIRSFVISDAVNNIINNGDTISIVTKVKDTTKPYWRNVPVFDAGSSLPVNITSNSDPDLSPFIKKAYYHDKDYSTLNDQYYVILTNKHLYTTNNITASEIGSNTLQFSEGKDIENSGRFDDILTKEFHNIDDYTQFGNITPDDFEFISVDSFELVNNSEIVADFIAASGVTKDSIVIYDSSQL